MPFLDPTPYVAGNTGKTAVLHSRKTTPTHYLPRSSLVILVPPPFAGSSHTDITDETSGSKPKLSFSLSLSAALLVSPQVNAYCKFEMPDFPVLRVSIASVIR